LDDLPASIGINTYTLVVNSREFPDQVKEARFEFELIVTCLSKQVKYVSGALSDLSFEIDPDQTTTKTIDLPLYETIPCKAAVPIELSIADEVTGKSPPSFISTSDGKMTIQLANGNETGVFKLKVVALASDGPANDEVRFTLKVEMRTKSTP
jgi:hypothetical protein